MSIYYMFTVFVYVLWFFSVIVCSASKVILMSVILPD